MDRDSRRKYDREYYLKNKDKLYARKKITSKLRKQETYKKLKEFCKTNSCEACGEDDFVVLEFDHKETENKKFNVSDMITHYYSFEKIVEEIKKCRILCANCHRRKTAKQFGWYS